MDRALHLPTGELVHLPSSTSPALREARVYVPDQGLFELRPNGAERLAPATPWSSTRLVAPPATDGKHLAVLGEQRLTVYSLRGGGWPMWDVDPREWHPPVVAWPWVAWIAADESIWRVNVEERSDPERLTAGPASRLSTDGRRLAWSEADALILLEGDDQDRIDATTGFNAPPSLDAAAVCWESRGDGGVDVVCSDGVELTGPGDHTWPSRSGAYLLFRVDGKPWLHVVAD